MSEKKIVLVINKNLEPGVALNAATHLGLGLHGMLFSLQKPDVESINFQNYKDADGNDHAFVSALPLIVLRGKSGEIRKCRNALQEANLPFVDYTNCMVGGTYTEQIERARSTSESEIEYYAICAIGSKEELDPITRKFSLWK